MYFYEEKHSDGSVTYCETNMKRDTENFNEITESEYTSIFENMMAEAQGLSRTEEAARIEAEQTYIEQLEEENASLLFQLLTGEELTNV